MRGSVDGRGGTGGIHGDGDIGVGFGRVQFDPFCDVVREVY
jgi:hypothetical protein